MRRLCLAVATVLIVSLPAWGRQPDATGLWVANFMGNLVECHLEQRGIYLYGLAFVTTASGERNTYHVAGTLQGKVFYAWHGGGSNFQGTLESDDKVEGLMNFANGAKVAMQARRERCGKTLPGGLDWPPNYPPPQQQ
ncbi:hypothetical protein JCM15519_16150 [Fundidesulfovibrio butyratiphilus]